MSTTVRITRDIADNEPNASSVVSIKHVEGDDRPAIEINQDNDRIYMSLEHAKAVSAALAAAISEQDQPA